MFFFWGGSACPAFLPQFLYSLSACESWVRVDVDDGGESVGADVERRGEAVMRRDELMGGETNAWAW